MCMIDGGERPEFFSESTPKARKPHRCGECGRTITVGETYRRDFTVQEGHASTWLTCSHCTVAQQWLAKNCGGWLFEGVIEDLQEHASEYPPLAFGIYRVVVGARRQWKRMGQCGVLMPLPKMPASIESLMVQP